MSTMTVPAEFASVAHFYPADPTTVSCDEAERIEEEARAAHYAAQKAHPYRGRSVFSVPLKPSEDEQAALAAHRAREEEARLFKRFCSHVATEAYRREN